MKVQLIAEKRTTVWKVCWRMTPIKLYRMYPFEIAFAKGTQSTVVRTSTPSLIARVMASLENMLAKC